jgi:hypothetical protein
LGFIDGTTLPVFGGRYHPMLASRQLTALLDAAMGAGWDSHPLENAALARRTPSADIYDSPLSRLCGHGKIKKTTTKMICIKDPRRNLSQL